MSEASTRGWLGVGRTRTPAEVVHDHLTRWRNRDLDGDLARNYDRDVLTLTPQTTYLGWSGPRALDADLEGRAPGGRIMIDAARVGGGVAVVSWSVGDPDTTVRVQGVDSYFIRRGQILTHTREIR